MKVKYINHSTYDQNIPRIYHNLKEYMSIGDIFNVIGIRFYRNTIYYYIFNEQHLFEAPNALFEIIEHSVSAHWIIKIWNDDETTFWPELFYKEDFLENFAERETMERELFSKFYLKYKNEI